MADPTTFQKKRAPTLYFIIAIKLLKGLSFLTLAIVTFALSNNDLPGEYRQGLRYFHLNPERRFWAELATQVGRLTETRMLWASVGTAFYSLFSLVEGVGLLFRISWACWLSIGESAFFIPIEIFELVHRPSLVVLVVLVLNIFMVWYLYANRERLFRHHHH